jgi:hypothetical protein
MGAKLLGLFVADLGISFSYLSDPTLYIQLQNPVGGVGTGRGERPICSLEIVCFEIYKSTHYSFKCAFIMLSL